MRPSGSVVFGCGNALVMGVLSALKDVLFPDAVGMVLDRLAEVGGVVVAEAHGVVPELTCPDCATVSCRVHSRYGRRLAEYPVGGRRVVVKLPGYWGSGSRTVRPSWRCSVVPRAAPYPSIGAGIAKYPFSRMG
jgi:hypothetical protein